MVGVLEQVVDWQKLKSEWCCMCEVGELCNRYRYMLWVGEWWVDKCCMGG